MQKISKKDQTPNKPYHIALAYVDLEPSPKAGSDKIKMLRPTRKNTTENKLYLTAWTHKQEPST